DQRFEGNRYTFQPLVESTDSVQRIGDQLRPQFDGGITLVSSDQLSELRTEVYADE
ncbi:DNA polymerase beta, partial [Halorubrum sp. SP3]